MIKKLVIVLLATIMLTSCMSSQNSCAAYSMRPGGTGGSCNR